MIDAADYDTFRRAATSTTPASVTMPEELKVALAGTGIAVEDREFSPGESEGGDLAAFFKQYDPSAFPSGPEVFQPSFVPHAMPCSSNGGPSRTRAPGRERSSSGQWHGA